MIKTIFLVDSDPIHGGNTESFLREAFPDFTIERFECAVDFFDGFHSYVFGDDFMLITDKIVRLCDDSKDYEKHFSDESFCELYPRTLSWKSHEGGETLFLSLKDQGFTFPTVIYTKLHDGEVFRSSNPMLTYCERVMCPRRTELVSEIQRILSELNNKPQS